MKPKVKNSRLSKLSIALALGLLFILAACNNPAGEQDYAMEDVEADYSEEEDPWVEEPVTGDKEALLAIWKSAEWTGGASEEYLGVWYSEDAEDWPYLYVYNDRILFEAENGSRMVVDPYFVCREAMDTFDLHGGWLGIGGARSMETETLLRLTDSGGVVVENADDSLDFSSFPREEYLPFEPYDLSSASDIASITPSNEELDEYGNPLLKYQVTVMTYDWATEEDSFYMSGSFVNKSYDEMSLEVFREYTLFGKKGVLSEFTIDNTSQLDALKAMGAISTDNEMLHESVQMLHVQSAAATQMILLSRDSDGITHIAALTFDNDAGTYEWDGESYETQDMCAVSRYGRFCFINAGSVATTAKP